MTQPAVTMFGRVQVSGRATVDLGGVNLPALLCLLAATPGRAVPNERLTGALWPDADPAHAQHSLASLVYQLNRIIDPVLGSRRTVRTVKGVGRALRVDPTTIDTVVFERRVADGEASAATGRHDAAVTELIDALGLWRGEPFGGLAVPALAEAAARLATTRAHAESVLVDSALRCGRAADVIPLLDSKVASDPEDEQAVGALARALVQVGEVRRATEIVGSCVEMLRRRGIEPTPQLRRVAAAVAAGDRLAGAHPEAPPRRLAAVAGSLVGRHVERGSIGNWFVGATTAGSRGRVLVITGEPGIGKTALLDAWLRGMHDRLVAIRTHCSPEQVLPFEAFAPLVGTTADHDGPSVRGHVLERVSGRLRALGGEHPLLAIDDAQWLTPASVGLLDELVADDKLEMRVILTLRHHDLAANQPLAELLDRWRAAQRVETLQPGPLSDAEIELLAARHLRAEPRSRTAGELRAVTGGNPLFVIQVAQAGSDGIDVATTVEHLLGRYLIGLSGDERRSVETAALLGTDGSLGRLARCTRRDELAEIEALDAVGDGRLMHVSPVEGRYRFVHELARQIVTEQIPVGRAMRVHLAIADALESEPQHDVFALAHHLRCALPAAAPQRAAVALLAAARRARELGDFDASRTLARQAYDASDDQATHADALVLMASGAQSMGERESAARHVAAAIELALESGSTATLARVLYVKSVVMMSWANHDIADRIVRSVQARLRDEPRRVVTPDDLEVVELVWALCLDKPGSALQVRRSMAERVLRIARESGDDLALLRALHANMMVGQMLLVDPDDVLGCGAEALAIARRDKQPMMALLVDSQVAVALLRAGRLHEARIVHARMTRSEPDVQDVAVRWAARARSANLALVADELALAEQLIVDARGFGEPLSGGRPAQEYVNQMGVLHLARGSLPGLNQVFGAWFDQLPGPVWHWAAGPGELHGRDDADATARREVLITNMGSPVPPHSDWLAELTIAAEYAYRSDDVELGKLVAGCIEPFVHQHAVFGVALSLGSMWRPYALALATAGDQRGARDAMATARLVNAGAGLALWERLSRLPGR